jgi:hypothetical protein
VVVFCLVCVCAVWCVFVWCACVRVCLCGVSFVCVCVRVLVFVWCSLMTVAKELARYKLDLVGVQEIRKGQSGHSKSRKL